MLRPPSDFDRDLRIRLLLDRAVGYDPDTETQLVVTDGRRKPGRPRRYLLRRWDAGAGAYIIMGRVEGRSPEEALGKANRR